MMPFGWRTGLSAIAAVAAVVIVSVIVSWAWGRRIPAPASDLKGDVIVVLSGPGGAAHLTAGETRARVAAGVALLQAGAAQRIVMSGLGVKPGRISHAAQMAARARELGVADSAILVEDRSGSTLQNAWFTAALPDIRTDQRILLVTHRYHLPRAWASFRWAGFRDLVLVPADADHMDLPRGLLTEGVKWPLNAVRGGLGLALMAMGVPETRVLPWLG